MFGFDLNNLLMLKKYLYLPKKCMGNYSNMLFPMNNNKIYIKSVVKQNVVWHGWWLHS